MSASASARLGDFVEILSGFAFDAANFSDEGDIALIRIRDVLRGRSNTFYRGAYDEKYLINEGEILIGMDGEFNRARWQSAPALLNQRVCKISSNSPRLADEYLFHFLPAALKSIEDATSFVTVKHLSAKQIRDIEIPLPPVEEQRRIATILDQAETLRTQRRQALAHLDTLTQSLFLDIFGEQSDFPLVPLDQVCELITDGTHYTPTYAEEGVIFLSAKNVTSGRIDWAQIKHIPESLHQELHKRVAPKLGDVLMAKNGTTGVAAIVDRDCTFDIYVSLALLRPSSSIGSVFLHAALNSPLSKKQFNAALKGIGVPNLHLRDIRGAKIPVPPLSLQQTFATRIQAIEALKATHRSALAQLDALFASLQQRAFAGEL